MRIPGATYRIQFTPSFGFREAKRILPYLKKLGISDLYASPVFLAAEGSVHGYDVADPNRINPGLGTETDFNEFAAAIQEHDMGLIQDFVPNHMAYDQRNAMLMDILENGRFSRFFRFFDIQWDHPGKDLSGKVLTPFLGKSYEACLKDGDIRLEFDVKGFGFTYDGMRFPLKIDSYAEILEQASGKGHPPIPGLSNVLRALRRLPRQASKRKDSIHRIKDILWQIYSSDRSFRKRVDSIIRKLNGNKTNPGGFNLLERLLSAQFFRFSFWKDAAHEINYRRFFSINGLIALSQEKKEVFQHVHRLILRLCRDGIVKGLRVDHIDGLYYPSRYLAMLREKTGNIYIVVEKILGKDESLPSGWPVQGTTGYEFAAAVNGVLCQKGNMNRFSQVYKRLTECEKTFEKKLQDGKRLVLENDFSGDLDNLVHHAKKIADASRKSKNLTFKELKDAVSAAIIHFPVYRTYTGPDGPSRQDRCWIRNALNRARRDKSYSSPALSFLKKNLLFSPAGRDTDQAGMTVDFVMRFQQLTGTAMAKGFEDTALYNYNRLLSLNEVGSSPGDFGINLANFHRFNESRQNFRALGLNATATHDAKRGEDVRARLNVLSEIPQEWEERASLWMYINGGKKPYVRGKPFPEENEEYHLYQTLVGAFPFYEEGQAGFCERIKGYVVKALREGKVYSSWFEPDEECEAAFKTFAEDILCPAKDNVFLRDFIPFQRMVANYGIFNSLTQTLLKITAPGIPDFYQGTELWDLNLVDPDNRRPVDFERRTVLLREILEKAETDPAGLIKSLLKTKENGMIKLFLIAKALSARALRRSLFERGTYKPVLARGAKKNHLVAFARIWDNQWAFITAPRFLVALVREGEDPLGKRVWGTTAIDLPDGAPRCWREIFTGERLETDGRIFAGEVLKYFPVSLLLNEDEI